MSNSSLDSLLCNTEEENLSIDFGGRGQGLAENIINVLVMALDQEDDIDCHENALNVSD